MALAATITAFTGCAGPAPVETTGPPSAGPAATTVASVALSSPASAGEWTAAAVDLGSLVTDQPSGSPPALCSPCHAAGISLLFGVSTANGGFLAAGVEEPPAHPAVWRSTDGSDWARVADLPAEDGSNAVAAASDGSRVVIVGRRSAGAAAWASDDGVHWSESPASAALAGSAGGTAMTSVVAWHGRFVAGGFSDDPIHNRRSAVVWTSTDGLAWTRAQAADEAGFDGGHILGLAASDDRLVAVGTTNDETHGEGVAWTSTDGTTWSRATASALASGIPQAVAARAGTFTAVGLAEGDTGAEVWQSGDGVGWHAVQDQAAFHFGTSAVRMLGVAAGPVGLVAVGWRSDAGNGSAAMWRSADGASWSRDPFQTIFSGATASGIAVGSDGIVVAVGTSGYPDNDQAAGWVRRP